MADEQGVRAGARRMGGAVCLAIAVALCAGAINTSTASVTRAHVGAPARPCLVPGVGRPLDQIWRPKIRAAIDYEHRRSGEIAFAVRTDAAFYGDRPDRPMWSASVLKAMLLVAYLDRPGVRRASADCP